MIRQQIINEAEASHHDLVAIRRHLHQHPELSFEEKETMAFISNQLDAFGIEHTNNIGGFGIVGLIKGKNPEKKTVAIRGDMDALPIQETNQVEYCSTVPGKMHACGHDVHTTCILGAARILHQHRESFEGTVKLIFQPAEEKLPGGASIMIKDGVLEQPKVDSIFGQHVHPPLPAGKVAFRPGMMMASADEIHMTVKGRGGHAALPQNVIDPVLISAHIITSLQQIVSRKANPGVPTVISFGKISANGATNVIPDEVRIEGTFRTFDEAWRKEVHTLIQKMATSIAESMGGSCDVLIPEGYPHLKNHEALTQNASDWAKQYLGEENVEVMPLRMTGEDFAFYTHHADACFYRLGTGNPSKGITSPVHTSTFDIDEDALKVGAGLMAWLVLNELAS
ncbi:MAG: amidohydrolase [Bacteroidetes bacterium]|nr:amidohydrolase [Bacteroidota bacterium]